MSHLFSGQSQLSVVAVVLKAETRAELEQSIEASQLAKGLFVSCVSLEGDGKLVLYSDVKDINSIFLFNFVLHSSCLQA